MILEAIDIYIINEGRRFTASLKYAILSVESSLLHNIG